MHVPDLTRTAAPPYWFSDESLDLAPGTPLFLVGWLEDAVPTSGAVEDAVVNAVVDAELRMHSLSDHSCGAHACELCVPPCHRPRVQHGGREVGCVGHGFYLLEHGGKAYVAPRLLLHYIVDHGYRPPDEFLAAVRDGRFVADIRPTFSPGPPRTQLPYWLWQGVFIILFTMLACGLVWMIQGRRL